MPWQLLRLQTTPEKAEEIEQLLVDAGAQSVSLVDAKDQPLFQTEPGATQLWDYVVLCGMFDDSVNLQQVTTQLKASYQSASKPLTVRIEQLRDQDWEKTWMDRFHPMRFGSRLWICPSWHTPPDPSAVNIMLDPGLAFGTGTHPTTALCLEWLEQHHINGKRVIDYGCGSGVLAIAAALLGAEQVLALDNDPQAIIATETNRAANQLDPANLSCFLPEQFPPDPSPMPADILVANILAGPLQQLAGEFAKLVREGGDLVLSGILPDQCAALLACYQHWFEMENPVIRDGWARLHGTRRYSYGTYE